ncbi:hypothetical protein, partial [Bifidobacterium simiarum]|uniref:hypothetical protein n=1 Tax=Bifidobacterium simiarum TaxID=2045441 RepID=UPI001BDD8274
LWWSPVVVVTCCGGHLLWWSPVVVVTCCGGHLLWWSPVVVVTCCGGHLRSFPEGFSTTGNAIHDWNGR